MNNFRILSYDEESQLNLEGRKRYYKNLRTFLLHAKYNDLGSSWIQFTEKLNKNIIRILIDTFKGYELTIEGLENVPNSPVIYASTHQEFYDHLNIILSIPNHAVMLSTINLTPTFKFLTFLNGVIGTDKFSNTSFETIIEQMKFLAKGKSIISFPEAAYNFSPNKLHLPLHEEIIDMARKMQVPIVPIVQEYTYDESIKNMQCIESCQIKFGKPIYVDITDNNKDKSNELSEIFSTLRFELTEEKGSFKNCSNAEYINYMLSRIEALKKFKASTDDEIYQFYHINDMDFDEFGNTLDGKSVGQLNEINNQHLLISDYQNELSTTTSEILKLSKTI